MKDGRHKHNLILQSTFKLYSKQVSEKKNIKNLKKNSDSFICNQII